MAMDLGRGGAPPPGIDRIAGSRTVVGASRKLWLLPGLAALTLIVFLSLALGARPLSPATVWNVLLGGGAADERAVVLVLRLPRTVLGVLVGASLGMAGAMMQVLTRNPLADPGLLGVNAGAAFCIAVGGAVLGGAAAGGYIWLAFAGACAGACVVHCLDGGDHGHRRACCFRRPGRAATGVSIGRIGRHPARAVGGDGRAASRIRRLGRATPFRSRAVTRRRRHRLHRRSLSHLAPRERTGGSAALTVRPAMASGKSSTGDASLSPRLQARDVTLAYDRRVIVDRLSVDIPDRSFTVIIGANASGKSTFLSALSRLLRPVGGHVYLDGRQIWKAPAREVARKLGLLPQSSMTPDAVTVFDLVGRGRYPHRGFFRQWSEEDEAAVLSALEATRTVDLAGRSVDELSGGQRQRVLLAMVLAQNTPILLLDEPTTYLDIAHQIDLLDLLAELNARGRTIVAVLHDLNQACRYASHLVAMKEGAVAAHGRPGEIITERLVADVFGLACIIIPDPVSGTPLIVPKGRQKTLAEVSVRSPERPSWIHSNSL